MKNPLITTLYILGVGVAHIVYPSSHSSEIQKFLQSSFIRATMAAISNFDSIADITDAKEDWTIKARVVRLWFVPDSNRPNNRRSMELVLIDSEGSRIHASVRKTLIYLFERDLSVGPVYSIHFFGVAANSGDFKTSTHSYKVNFQYDTQVVRLDDGNVPSNIYSFVPFGTIVSGGYDMSVLVDVIGLLTRVGTERDINRNGIRTKMNVICLEAEGSRMECTLFGPYVDELNAFLATGETENAIVIIQFAKVKFFQEKFHLQNAMHCTKIVFNPDCSEAHDIRKKRTVSNDSPSQALTPLTDVSKISVEEDFLKLTPKITIAALKDCKEESFYVVLGTITHIIPGKDWWYMACICNRSVYPDSKMYFCENCNKHVVRVSPRYRIMVHVTDETDLATFVLFEGAASMLLNKSCAEMIESSAKASGASFPKEISDLVEKKLLFKVEIRKDRDSFGTRFEPTYPVKKVCNNVTIIEKFMGKFMELYLENVDSNLDGASLGSQKVLSSDGVVAQDLTTKFSDAVVSNEPHFDEGEGVDLAKDSEDLTPLKRDSATQQSNAEFEVPPKMLKKDIKIEKD